MTAKLEPRPPASTDVIGPTGRPVTWAGWLVAGLAAGALAAAALWLIVPQLTRPYVYDDVSFALGARAVAETGVPYGNQGYLLHLYWQREQWALWHPPLYMYLLGGTVALLGPSEAAARSLGVVSLLIVAALTFDLARCAVRDRGGEPSQELLAGVLAVALLVLNPLAIQATAILDIDNTVLMVLVTAFAWATIRLPERWGPRTALGLAFLFAVCLWAKLTTPLVLAVALIFVRLFQGRGWGAGWRGALQAAGVCALGAILFVVTWLSISRLLSLPVDYTVDVMVREAIESVAGSRDRLVSIPAFVAGAAPTLLWIGPFFCLLLVAAGLPRFWSLLRGRGLRACDLLVVLGAAIYLMYIFKLAGNFPKYHAAMLPVWSAAGAALVACVAGRPTLLRALAVLASGVLLAVWLMPRMSRLWGIQFEPGLNAGLIAQPAAIPSGCAVAWALVGRRAPWRGVPVALLVATLAWNVSLDLAQRDRQGSTTYFYGRDGQQATARALDMMLRPDETYVAAKDVAWYTRNQRYVDHESWKYLVWEVQSGEFDGSYLGHDIRILVLTAGDPSFRTAYGGLLLRRDYALAGEYGDFQIYVRR